MPGENNRPESDYSRVSISSLLEAPAMVRSPASQGIPRTRLAAHQSASVKSEKPDYSATGPPPASANPFAEPAEPAEPGDTSAAVVKVETTENAEAIGTLPRACRSGESCNCPRPGAASQRTFPPAPTTAATAASGASIRDPEAVAPTTTHQIQTSSQTYPSLARRGRPTPRTETASDIRRHEGFFYGRPRILPVPWGRRPFENGLVWD